MEQMQPDDAASVKAQGGLYRNAHAATSVPASAPTQGSTFPMLDSQISHAHQIQYWSSQSADVSGMLGGYPQICRIDLQGSKIFIAKVRRQSRISNSASASCSGQDIAKPGTLYSEKAAAFHGGNSSNKVHLAVDCGAGIGRITQGLLVNIAETVDVVEPVKKFTDVLRELKFSQDQGKVGEIFNQGLESWSPPVEKKYDLIWVQWCLSHLRDEQVVKYLQRAAGALAGYGGKCEEGEGQGQGQGWIMVKENLSTNALGEDVFHDEDSTVTRSDRKFKLIFEEAGLKIVKMEVQRGFPKSLYPVKMYALRPK